MRYDRISADCHVDLCWLPPDLFTTNASAALRDRMPYVTDGPKGRMWTTKRGASLGMVNGMGSAGRQYIPGKIHRADRMAATGLYDDGLRGIRRLTFSPPTRRPRCGTGCRTSSTAPRAACGRRSAGRASAW